MNTSWDQMHMSDIRDLRLVYHLDNSIDKRTGGPQNLGFSLQSRRTLPAHTMMGLVVQSRIFKDIWIELVVSLQGVAKL